MLAEKKKKLKHWGQAFSALFIQKKIPHRLYLLWLRKYFINSVVFSIFCVIIKVLHFKTRIILTSKGIISVKGIISLFQYL